MFVEESEWIRDRLAALPLKPGATVVNVGSSTREYREVLQPFVEANLFAPLSARGLDVTHLDAKAADGVDVVCDITTIDGSASEAVGRTFDLVLCNNLLEHVEERLRTAGAVAGLVAPGGYLLVTVPRAYRRHLDPIDTMYRPSPWELARMFTAVAPDMSVVDTHTVEVLDPRAYKRLPSRLPLWGRRERLRLRLKPLRWRQACVLLRRPPAHGLRQ